MNLLDAMTAFVRVAELTSFTQAAQSLGVPKASVSTAVQRLETLLGTRLLHRTTRRVQTTEDGQALYERCKDLLADIDELRDMFRPAPPGLRGRLRVELDHGVARELVLAGLPDFLRAHPGLEVDIGSGQRAADGEGAGFDCRLRVGAGGSTDASLAERPLGALRVVNVASAGYVAAFGTPRSLDDLTGHRLVQQTPAAGAPRPGFVHARTGDDSAHSLAMASAVTVHDSDACRAAALAGLGIAQIALAAVHGALARGQLVELLPQHRPPPLPVALLYANRRQPAQRVRAFMDWLAEALEPHLA